MIQWISAAAVLILGITSFFVKNSQKSRLAEFWIVFFVFLATLPGSPVLGLTILVLGGAFAQAVARARTKPRIQKASLGEKFRWQKIFLIIAGGLFFGIILFLFSNRYADQPVLLVAEFDKYNLAIIFFLAAIYFKGKVNWKN